MTYAAESSRTLGRRALLRGVSAASALGVLGAQSTTSALASAVPAMLGSNCVLTPAAGQGPVYLSLGLLRRDIAESQPGLRMTLVFRVVRASDCSPVEGAYVDLWHGNFGGDYSGFAFMGSAGETWLRGVQATNANGICRFDTVFPGWYPGRAGHIHTKIYQPPNTVFTTQFFVPTGFNEMVWRQPPYEAHGNNPTQNEDDLEFHPENVMSVRPLSMASLPDLGGGVRHVIAAKTIALA